MASEEDRLNRRKAFLIGAAFAILLAVGVGIGLWKYHEKPQFCATCHIMAPYLESWQSSRGFAQAHREAGIKCLDCHQPEIRQQVDEAIKYVTRRYEEPLEMRTFTDNFCLRCHGSLAEISKRTEGYKADISLFQGHDVQIDQLTEKDLTINPHASHVSQDGCFNCHKMHRDSPGLQYCFGCHHKGGLVACSQCHSE